MSRSLRCLADVHAPLAIVGLSPCPPLGHVVAVVQVRLWNLTSGEQIQRMQGHADYVRAAAVNPVNGSIWATGIDLSTNLSSHVQCIWSGVIVLLANCSEEPLDYQKGFQIL